MTAATWDVCEHSILDQLEPIGDVYDLLVKAEKILRKHPNEAKYLGLKVSSLRADILKPAKAIKEAFEKRF